MIPFSRQSIDKIDKKNLLKTLNSNFLTQGPKVSQFEKSLKKFTGSKYVLATNSGSSALHVACLALGVKKGDIVWTVPNTFVASANCALNCGAKIDFVDIDKDTFNISVPKLIEKLIVAKKIKKLPKVLIPVHLAGQPTEQKIIKNLSKKFKFKILEDASHSIGARHYGEKVGSCKWSDITVFSFHPVKIITTAEGGAALTNDKKLNYKMKLYRDNGISKKRREFGKTKRRYPWYYEHRVAGFNYRMNDLSASLGLSQLGRINKFLKKRNDIASIYKKHLSELPIKFQKILPHNFSSYHLFIIQIDLDKTKFKYEQIFKRFRNNNFFVNLHYMPIHLSPYFRKLGFKKNDYPNSEKYQKKSFSIPIFYDLKENTITKIVKLIRGLF